MPMNKTLNLMQTMGTGDVSVKLIVKWRSSSNEQVATWRSSKDPYKSRCEGEPEKFVLKKIASYIATL